MVDDPTTRTRASIGVKNAVRTPMKVEIRETARGIGVNNPIVFALNRAPLERLK